MITLERLKSLLDYCEETGFFKWKEHRRPQNPIGSKAGWWCKSTNSYRIEIDDKIYLAHRLVWFYVYGIWPTKQIDHKNRNNKDNRISNLREADNSENQANMPAKSNNSTGFRGIGFDGKKYIVQLYKIRNNENLKVYGTFKTLEEAKSFAEVNSRLLHGEFSYHNHRVNPHG
jgi:hypothetical protein